MSAPSRSITTSSVLKSAIDYARAALDRARQNGEESASIELALSHLMRALNPDAEDTARTDTARRFSLLELE